MTISKEMLEASGLAFDIDDADIIDQKYRQRNYSAVEYINQILCDKLFYSEGLPFMRCGPDPFVGPKEFIIYTKPQPIPEPKKVEVTSELISSIWDEWCNCSGASFHDYLKQKLFGDKS